jgi:hypothetical protein
MRLGRKVTNPESIMAASPSAAALKGTLSMEKRRRIAKKGKRLKVKGERLGALHLL